MDKLNRIYIEISNICNLQCSFCPIVERDKKIMPVDQFAKIIDEVSPHTKEICLHLMGEPLAHPEFERVIAICEENFIKHQVQINLTTNGILLKKYENLILNSQSIRQINFSIQSFQDNFKDRDIAPYLNDILSFSKKSLEMREDLYINYRLWNIFEEKTQNDSNLPLIEKMSAFFGIEINQSIDVSSIKSKKITGRIYFHFDSRFTWPSLQLPKISEVGFCHALSTHIGIHADGTVVPCCLDKEAITNLGNLNEVGLDAILTSERAVRMKDGLRHKKLVEKLCQHCPYIKRFQ